MLTEAGFAPFGTVIRHPGEGQRHYLPGVLATEGHSLRPAVWVNRLSQTRWPVTVTALERHPLGAQSFAPLGDGRLLAVVAGAESGRAPDPGSLLAFLVPEGAGIAYRPGVWHHGLLSMDRTLDVLIVMAAHGIDDETEHATLPAPVLIEEPAP